MRDPLKGALGQFRAALRPKAREAAAVTLTPCCTFGALLEERLKGLERELQETRARLNGLLFLVVGAVAVEVVLRLVR